MTSRCFAFNTWPWRYWAADAPDAIAIDSETPLTWQALRALVDAQQRTFNDAPVVVLNSHDALQSLVVTLLAAWQAGKQTLVLNQALSADVQTAVLDNLGPFQWAHAHQSVPDAQSARNMAPWHIDMPLTLTLTSGSTGAPKAVVHGGRQHLASAAGLIKRLPFTGVRASQTPDRWLLSLPLYHVSGLAIVWRWLLAGGELGIYPCRGEHLVNALKRVTHASLVPTQLYRVLPALKDEAEPRRLAHVLLGGAAIPTALTQDAEAMGIACWCGYGMTETASTVTLKRADGQDDVGAPLPYRDVQIRDDGEIIHRGETLALGYWQAGQLHPLDAEQGLASRDLGRWQTQQAVSVLRVVGRLDNQFICGGENVQPEAIEAHLQRLKGVTQAMVVPIVDREFGHRPLAIVQSASPFSPRVLAEHCASLAPYQRPAHYLCWPETQQDGQIKPSRHALAQWAQAYMKS
ncbi:hypothetical protein BZG78_06035 [Salinivibrio sp. MA351]|uniref:AMP-binding protein n=1 Tax=Salinivibrio sp. MA351 TaxID=1909453 RepID=UPI000988B28D|nr:AMP-binding protein [Salinivibrio sp. MA351]OOE99986.1 hypothetical protein BZG78_06035 [Salinivibrio sp. MA351]